MGFTLGQAIAHLYHGGRRFGGHRKANAAPLARVFWLLASPAVPFVLLGRTIRRVAAHQPRRLIQVATSLPYMLLLVAGWSAGEAVGYLAPVAAPDPAECRQGV